MTAQKPFDPYGHTCELFSWVRCLEAESLDGSLGYRSEFIFLTKKSSHFLIDQRPAIIVEPFLCGERYEVILTGPAYTV
jgi:hypothetical protein